MYFLVDSHTTFRNDELAFSIERDGSLGTSTTTSFARDAQYGGSGRRRRDALFSTCFRIIRTCEWSTGSPAFPCSPFIFVVFLARSRRGSSQVAARGQRGSVLSSFLSYSFVLSSDAAMDGRRPPACRIKSATRHAFVSKSQTCIGSGPSSVLVGRVKCLADPTCHLDALEANLPVL